MSSTLKEKIAICYTCAGESYRESAYKRIKENYFDDDNLYYFIITDDKDYFSSLKRQNLIVQELSEFYPYFPVLEKNEYFLESSNKSDYAKKFVDSNYLFPFSTYRFNIFQALQYKIKNVAIMCTDTYLDIERVINGNFLDSKGYFYNAVSEWDDEISNRNMNCIVEILKEKFNLSVDNTLRVLDAAGRFYIANTLDDLNKFFTVWNTVIETLYENGKIDLFRGHYVINDEYILAPIYNALNLSKRDVHCTSRMFEVRHNALYERFWRFGGDGTMKEHTDYDEFLKINNLTNG